MKTNLNLLQTRIFCAVALGIGSSFGLAAATENSADTAPGSTANPWSQLGVKAGADSQGDALAVIPTTGGARLRCVFQRLEGEATREGLWLTSTVTNAVSDRFRLVAVEVGRGTPSTLRSAATEDGCAPSAVGGATDRSANIQPSTSGIQLSATGNVSIDGQSVRFTRPGLVEEYTASMDGVRQDFVVLERSPGLGELDLRLAVSGASVEPAAFGAQVVLANSGRKIAYNRLKVTDANGRELPARMEVATAPESKIRNQKSKILRVVVNDAEAVYPVRIDPTFGDANWSSMGGMGGADDTVLAAVVDGSGNLYIGGVFSVAGDVIANRVAKWNGSSWSALGSGIEGGGVTALAVSGSNVYAGGLFTTAGGSAATNIAKWDGSSWSALGSGMSGQFEVSRGVLALAVSGSDLYAGGDFTSAGGSAAKNIAKWDGSSWSALGSGVNGSVSALAVSGSNLYAGGEFTSAGGSAASNLAKWDGSSWSALGSGINGGVCALAVSGNNLYAGGWFTTAGGGTANCLAKWDGSSWTAMGSGTDSGVKALTVVGNDVYAGGEFPTDDGTPEDGSPVNYIAKWDGISWTTLGAGLNNGVYVYALTSSGNDLYAGGLFATAGGGAASSIAKWDGSNWAALGSGMSGQGWFGSGVFELAVSGSELYAGGSFNRTGDSAANHLAKWNGSSWSALGSGIGSASYASVSALAVSGSDLYVGGWFTTAGGSAATNIAKWDGSSWSALGSGLNGGGVTRLVVSGSNVYAGGFFTTAGGSPDNYHIAKWDGRTWSALGSGLGSVPGQTIQVSALAVSGSDLYVGGSYITTEGASAGKCVAKWDGSSWTGLGLGRGDEHVFALAISGGNLYAGGWFTTAGGSAATNIAKWDGSSWSALGSGLNGGGVSALVVSGSDLYAADWFSTEGGISAGRIAKWDGSAWTELASGIGGVSALVVSGTDLYAGGAFTIAGGKVSAYVARAYLRALPTLAVLRSGENVTVSWPVVDTAGFALEQAGPLAAPAGWVTNSATVTNDGTNKSVTLPATNSSQFFRLRRP